MFFSNFLTVTMKHLFMRSKLRRSVSTFTASLFWTSDDIPLVKKPGGMFHSLLRPTETIKPCLVSAFSFASNVKNGIYGNKWWWDIKDQRKTQTQTLRVNVPLAFLSRDNIDSHGPWILVFSVLHERTVSNGTTNWHIGPLCVKF